MKTPQPGYYAMNLGGVKIPPYVDFCAALEELVRNDDDGAKATVHQIIRENPEGLLASIINRDRMSEDLIALGDIILRRIG